MNRREACGLLLKAWIASPNQAWAATTPIDLSDYKLTSLYRNDFDGPQQIAWEEDLIVKDQDGVWRRNTRPDPDAEWIVEGWGGVKIADRLLQVAPHSFDEPRSTRSRNGGSPSHMVVWLQRIFPSDLVLEFQVNANRSSNGLMMVFFCAEGVDGKDMFDTSLPPRRAEYTTYHSGSITNYSDSYWSRNTQEESVTNRLRKNPGFRLVGEGLSNTVGPTAATHSIRIFKFAGRIQVEVDGARIIDWVDPESPLGSGYIGFRSMLGVNSVSYSKLNVWSVKTTRK